MPSTAIFILGMHRSGTSLLTGLLKLAGVDLGSNLLLGAAAENRRGFWEHRDVLDINEELLARLSLSWFVPSAMPSRYWELPSLAPLARRASDLIHREFGRSPVWGIKDPRLCRLQEFWARACAGVTDSVRAVHVFRHPLEVADSLFLRNRIPLEQAILLWLFHNLDAVQHRSTRPLVSLPMSRLLADPVATIAAIRDHIGLTDPLPPAVDSEIRQFVEPALRHHHGASGDPRCDTPAGRLATRVHACLERLAAGEDVDLELADARGDLLEILQARQRPLNQRRHQPVDVVVPVYGALESTRRCIDSVLAAGDPAGELVVIDDASPDGAVPAHLRERAAEGRFLLLENGVNVGFVATANRGMRIHVDRDVVLLNSDTIVSPGWLTRLREAAYSNEWIGTVTPFSNNATICSYPVPQAANSLPPGYDAPRLDATFRAANRGLRIDLPTAVGFCMYIRRDCIEDVGGFDEARFGRGYGEETDFCMRAMKRGWRNVIAADVFIYHEGGVSFGAASQPLQLQATARMEEQHPEYAAAVARFLDMDPLAFARDAVDVARVKQHGTTELDAVMEERRVFLSAMRGRIRVRTDALSRELKTLDDALGDAQRIVGERETQLLETTESLAAAERLAAEAATQARESDRRQRELVAANQATERLAAERLERAIRLDKALAAAQKIVTDRTAQVAALDGQVRRLADAKALAEQMAVERLRQLADRSTQCRDAREAVRAAERLAAERLHELVACEARLKTMAAAVDRAEHLAAERLADVGSGESRVRDARASLGTARQLRPEQDSAGSDRPLTIGVDRPAERDAS